MDTVEANVALGLPVDNRKYDMAVQVLKYNKIESCKLISNNPSKIKALENVNIKVSPINCEAFINEHNQEYLRTKKSKLNHCLKGI